MFHPEWRTPGEFIDPFVNFLDWFPESPKQTDARSAFNTSRYGFIYRLRFSRQGRTISRCTRKGL